MAETNSRVKPAPGALSVLGAGLRYALSLVRRERREPAGGRVFWSSLTGALRPHFFVFPAGAALAGASGAEQVSEPWRIAVASAAAGLGWGVGQLLNDLLDVEADRVDAPQRPAVRGLLPIGPTAAVGLLLAIGVTIATVSVHPAGAFLALTSALLVAAYAPAKRVLLGLVAHALLIATAALIGAAAAAPADALFTVAERSRPELIWTGLVAALYLQANHEKDRAGDARAAYRTLALLLGVRMSALLRVIGALGLGGLWWSFGPRQPVAGALAALGVLFALASALPPLVRGTDRSSLSGYELAVHATAALMLAPALRLSTPLVLALFFISAWVTRRAFQQSDNP